MRLEDDVSTRKVLVAEREQFEALLKKCRQAIRQAGIDEIEEQTGVKVGSIVKDVSGSRYKVSEFRLDQDGNLVSTMGLPWLKRANKWSGREEYIYGRYELARE